jgi:RHS repeat-associated protein
MQATKNLDGDAMDWATSGSHLNPTPVRLPYIAGSRCSAPAAPRQPVARPSLARRRLILLAFVGAFLLAFGAPSAFADDHNPIGVTGAFEGVITTACAYNVLNHNARREIDDIVVPGSIGKYPLKMTRYYNSRRIPGYWLMGPGWTHEYSWGFSFANNKTQYPNGSEQDGTCADPLAVSDGWQTLTCGANGCVGDFRLADGGTVHFDDTNGYFQARIIKDPYNQTTTLTYLNSGFLSRVTEPGGRYLLFTYNGPQGLLSRVEAHGLGNATVDWVNYSYTSVSPGGNGASQYCLTGVAYSDGTSASYTYRQDNAPDHPGPPCPCSLKLWPLLQTCQDVRYKGAMRQICYEYQDNGPHGAIIAERYSLNGSINGPRVSKIDPPATSPIIIDPNFDTTYTEYRGDGPTRTFNYTELHLHRFNEDTCPTRTFGPADQQFPLSYTDFQGHTTTLGYDPNWYVHTVTDANGHTTTYDHGPPPSQGGIGQITKITHPGNTHIDYGYQAEQSPAIPGHYLTSITDERTKLTTYNRNGTTHQIYRTDYPDTGYETFTYDTNTNNFGQLVTHRFRNGAYESFAYDTRGLLTDKWNPKQNAIPGGNDPHTHYDYYTSGLWIDRVKKMTLPGNVTGNVATETYEYDRALDGSGVTNPTGAIVAGRGLVTKITYADNTLQSFRYDAYGNKREEYNELGKRTQYTYDDYNRVLAVINPLSQTETFSYLKPGASSSYLHTTNSVYTHTSRAGIVTTNIYDENFRKISSTLGSSTTSFLYDYVGNLTRVTDPRSKVTLNTYDARDRKITTTEASGTNVATTTVWHYDGASNVYRIDRPDSVLETRGFDALNRMTWQSVPRQVPGHPSTYLTTHFAYNFSGTIQGVTDPNGRYTTFTYDASDQKTIMSYHGGTQSQSWAYDNAHNLKSRTTVHNETQNFTYDNRNRKTGMSWSNTADSATFTYYDDNRLHTATNPNSIVTRTYDPAGRLTLDRQNVAGLASNKDVNYPIYDGDGKLIQMNVTGATYDYTFSYDAMGRFEKISPTGGPVAFQYYYDPASNETQRLRVLNGVTQLTPRDSLNRISRRDVKKGATPLSAEAYTYDRMSRLTDVDLGSVSNLYGYYWSGEMEWAQYGVQTQSVRQEGEDPDLDTSDNVDPWANYQPSPDPESQPEATPPPEDPLPDPAPGDLTAPDISQMQRWVSYFLDKAGNRQNVVDTGVWKNYVANTLNQYTTAESIGVTNGNEHEISGYNNVNYYYINDERLKQVTSGANTYNLYYDALGRCVKRSLNVGQGNVYTYYIYDGEKPVVEYNSTGAIAAKNLYGKGIDEILMRTGIDPVVNGGLPFYYQHNHEGSVTHLTNAAGAVIESYKYDAFGAPTMYNGATQVDYSTYNNRFLFTGREYAAANAAGYNAGFKFYEYRARAYNPLLGRFMSEDPKGFAAGDYNLFRYCHNDPEDMTDPMGLLGDPNRTGFSPLDNASVAGAEEYARTMGQAQWAMRWSTSGAIGMGMAGYQAWSLSKALNGFSLAHVSVGQQNNASSNRPDPSGYDAGEPYSAERTAENYQPVVLPNGHIVVTSQIYIKVFDRSHDPVRAGTPVSETAIPILNSRYLVNAPERKYFTDRTASNGQLPHPDVWQHVFSSRDGFVTRNQTLSSGGRNLNWTATQNINGIDIYTHQTGYFW